MTVFTFVFRRFFKSTTGVLFTVVVPLAAIFLPVGEWHPLPGGFQYYGIILLFLGARLGAFLIEDRAKRIMLRIGVAPLTHFQYLLQNLLAYSLIMLLINLLFVTGGVLVHGEALVNPILLFLLYSFFSKMAIGFSLAWYSLFRNKEAAFSVLIGLIMLMAMLGGMMWPIQAMPLFFQRLALLLPTYWLSHGLLLVARGATLMDLWLPLMMMVLFSLGFLMVGSKRRLV